MIRLEKGKPKFYNVVFPWRVRGLDKKSQRLLLFSVLCYYWSLRSRQLLSEDGYWKCLDSPQVNKHKCKQWGIVQLSWQLRFGPCNSCVHSFWSWPHRFLRSLSFIQWSYTSIILALVVFSISSTINLVFNLHPPPTQTFFLAHTHTHDDTQGNMHLYLLIVFTFSYLWTNVKDCMKSTLQGGDG